MSVIEIFKKIRRLDSGQKGEVHAYPPLANHRFTVLSWDMFLIKHCRIFYKCSYILLYIKTFGADWQF